jgi:hypothetical protein
MTFCSVSIVIRQLVPCHKALSRIVTVADVTWKPGWIVKHKGPLRISAQTPHGRIQLVDLQSSWCGIHAAGPQATDSQPAAGDHPRQLISPPTNRAGVPNGLSRKLTAMTNWNSFGNMATRSHATRSLFGLMANSWGLSLE